MVRNLQKMRYSLPVSIDNCPDFGSARPQLHRRFTLLAFVCRAVVGVTSAESIVFAAATITSSNEAARTMESGGQGGSLHYEPQLQIVKDFFKCEAMAHASKK